MTDEGSWGCERALAVVAVDGSDSSVGAGRFVDELFDTVLT